MLPYELSNQTPQNMKILRTIENDLLPSTMAEIVVALDKVEKPSREIELAKREVFAMLVNNVGLTKACEYVFKATLL